MAATIGAVARCFGLMQARVIRIRQPQCCLISTANTTFFSHSTKRKLRRRKQQLALYKQKQRQNKTEEGGSGGKESEKTEKKKEKDTRTVQDILFPNPWKNEPPLEGEFRWPRNIEAYERALPLAWAEYKNSWKGFLESDGFLVEDQEEIAQRKKERQEKMESAKATITENVKRNTKFIKEESENLKSQVQGITGIHTKEDFKRFVTEMMRLASDCVNAFMSGYRKGRDDEVEKVLTEYFQELEEEANKKPRRRPKRRVRNPYRSAPHISRKSIRRHRSRRRKELARMAEAAPSSEPAVRTPVTEPKAA